VPDGPRRLSLAEQSNSLARAIKIACKSIARIISLMTLTVGLRARRTIFRRWRTRRSQVRHIHYVRKPSTKAMTLSRTIFAALLLAGCATQQHPQITDEQHHQISYDFVACLHAATKKIDDGISPASTVALGLRSLCNREFAVVTDMLTSNLPQYGVEVFHRRYEDEMFMREATTAVLIERANRAGEASRQSPIMKKNQDGDQPANLR
jgi:hypothetical protein